MVLCDRFLGLIHNLWRVRTKTWTRNIIYMYVICICTAVIEYTPTVKLDHRNSWRQWALYSLGESYKSDHTRRRQQSKQWHRLSPTVEASVINVVCVCELFYWDWKFASMHTDLCTVQINVKACWITYVAALGCYFVYICVFCLCWELFGKLYTCRNKRAFFRTFLLRLEVAPRTIMVM
jgi:hypothetical protein